MTEQRTLPVLTFHAIDQVDSPVSTSPTAFTHYVTSLSARGWTAIPLDAALAGLARGSWPDKSFVLAFDDGYASVVEHAVPVVAELGFAATLFVATDLVGGAMQRYGAPVGTPAAPLVDWTMVKRLAGLGWTIGSHTRSHARLTALPPADADRELSESKQELEQRLGVAVTACAYPFGACNRLVEQLAGAHYVAAFGTRLAHVTAASRPTCLERIDGYYLRHWPLNRQLNSWSSSAYLAVRRLARATRGVERYR